MFNLCDHWLCLRLKSKWSTKWCDGHRCYAVIGKNTGRSCGEKRLPNSLYCIRHQN